MKPIPRYTLAVGLLLMFCMAATASWGRTYKIATVAWMGWSPLHVAEVKGFWDQLHIGVEVVDYDDPIIILEAAKAGKIDLAMDMAGSLVGVYMANEDVMAIAETNWSHGGDKIIVKKGHVIQEHIGEPLGIFLNLPSCLYFLDLYLETQRLQLSQFRIVEIHADDLTAQFIAGRVPAILNYDPWATRAVEAGKGMVLADSTDFEGCIPECIWGYRDRIQTISDMDLKKILIGWIRAVEWIQQPQNRSEFYTILNQHTFHDLPAYPASELSRLVKGVKIHNAKALFDRNRSGGGLNAYLTALKAFLKKNDRLDKDFKNTDIFDNQWILQALAEEFGLP